MQIGRLTIRAARWPGQQGFTWKKHPYGGMGRFGGGWRFKLGMAVGTSSLMLELGIGILTFGWKKKESAK
jgi:hypothetical protein